MRYENLCLKYVDDTVEILSNICRSGVLMLSTKSEALSTIRLSKSVNLAQFWVDIHTFVSTK